MAIPAQSLEELLDQLNSNSVLVAAQALVDLKEMYGEDDEQWPLEVQSAVLLQAALLENFRAWSDILDPNTTDDRLYAILHGPEGSIQDAASTVLFRRKFPHDSGRQLTLF